MKVECTDSLSWVGALMPRLHNFEFGGFRYQPKLPGIRRHIGFMPYRTGDHFVLELESELTQKPTTGLSQAVGLTIEHQGGNMSESRRIARPTDNLEFEFGTLPFPGGYSMDAVYTKSLAHPEWTAIPKGNVAELWAVRDDVYWLTLGSIVLISVLPFPTLVLQQLVGS